MQTILIDSGPLISLFHKKDNYHKKIESFFKTHKYQFITTLAVLTEVMYFLSVRTEAQLDFLKWLDDEGVRLAEIEQKDIPRITVLMKKYDDLPMDFADATLVVAAEKTGIREIISLDSDFDIYRLPGREKIKNAFTTS